MHQQYPTAPAYSQVARDRSTADNSYRVDGGEILTLFVVTLGPLKILGPFTRLTRGAPLAQLRRLAWHATAIAAFALLAGGFLGRGLLVTGRSRPRFSS